MKNFTEHTCKDILTTITNNLDKSVYINTQLTISNRKIKSKISKLIKKLQLNNLNTLGYNIPDCCVGIYHPESDIITISPECTFIDKESYLYTLLHEICHATGNEKRLNRKCLTNFTYKNNRIKEELIVELATFVIGNYLGLIIPYDYVCNTIESYSYEILPIQVVKEVTEIINYFKL